MGLFSPLNAEPLMIMTIALLSAWQPGVQEAFVHCFPVIYGRKLKQNLPLKPSGRSSARNTEQESGSTAS
jgi:hypothetical protein